MSSPNHDSMRCILCPALFGSWQPQETEYWQTLTTGSSLPCYYSESPTPNMFWMLPFTVQVFQPVQWVSVLWEQARTLVCQGREPRLCYQPKMCIFSTRLFGTKHFLFQATKSLNGPFCLIMYEDKALDVIGYLGMPPSALVGPRPFPHQSK